MWHQFAKAYVQGREWELGSLYQVYVQAISEQKFLTKLPQQFFGIVHQRNCIKNKNINHHCCVCKRRIFNVVLRLIESNSF